MGGLSARTLAQMRSQAMSKADSSCNVKLRATSPNGSGGTVTYSDMAGGPFPCRVFRRRTTAIEEEQAGTMTAVNEFHISLPYDVIPAPKDLIQIVDGPLFEIQGVDNGRTDPIQTICDVTAIDAIPDN